MHSVPAIKKPCFICLLLLLLIFSSASNAQPSFDDSTLKAVFSYKFAKFTQWPATKLANPEQSLNLCILGKGSISNTAIAAIKNKMVAKHQLRIERFQSGLLPDEAIQTCHILFISQSERKRIPGILTELNQQAILTISDIPTFSHQSGMITLLMIDQQLRFEINATAINKAGLSISSKILELGTIIDPVSDPIRDKEKP